MVTMAGILRIRKIIKEKQNTSQMSIKSMFLNLSCYIVTVCCDTAFLVVLYKEQNDAKVDRFHDFKSSR
jgi:hypothetical protein